MATDHDATARAARSSQRALRTLQWMEALTQRRQRSAAKHAKAITQIHTHRSNRHGSWRDGEGGALDSRAPRILDWMGAQTQRRQRRAVKATTSRLGVITPLGCGPQRWRTAASQRQRSQRARNAVALALPVDSACPHTIPRMPQRHPHPRIASMAYSQA